MLQRLSKKNCLGIACGDLQRRAPATATKAILGTSQAKVGARVAKDASLAAKLIFWWSPSGDSNSSSTKPFSSLIAFVLASSLSRVGQVPTFCWPNPIIWQPLGGSFWFSGERYVGSRLRSRVEKRQWTPRVDTVPICPKTASV